MEKFHNPRGALTAALLFTLAGVALLVAAYLNRDARGLIVGMQAVGGVLFLVVALLQYRRSQTG